MYTQYMKQVVIIGFITIKKLTAAVVVKLVSYDSTTSTILDKPVNDESEVRSLYLST